MRRCSVGPLFKCASRRNPWSIVSRPFGGRIFPPQRSSSDPHTELVGNFARLDHSRAGRTGLPEVIFGEGKNPKMLADIFNRMVVKVQSDSDPLNPCVLATRASSEAFECVQQKMGPVADIAYVESARLIVYPAEMAERLEDRSPPEEEEHADAAHRVAIVAAGTSDFGVCEEAAAVFVSCGVKFTRFYDVGVAGIHRLLAVIPEIRKYDAVVCVAGMEGALPSVLAGLIEAPLVAVPTSIGYGAAKEGFTPMLAMLTGCAPGVAVVNIDNGFGGAAMVMKILRMEERRQERKRQLESMKEQDANE